MATPILDEAAVATLNLKFLQAVLAKYPDAVRVNLAGGHKLVVSAKAAQDADNIEVMTLNYGVCFMPYVEIEGGRVYTDCRSSVLGAQGVLDDFKRNHPEEFKILLDSFKFRGL